LTNKLPPIPTPPATIKAPEEKFVAAVEEVIDNPETLNELNVDIPVVNKFPDIKLLIVDIPLEFSELVILRFVIVAIPVLIKLFVVVNPVTPRVDIVAIPIMFKSLKLFGAFVIAVSIVAVVMESNDVIFCNCLEELITCVFPILTEPNEDAEETLIF
jgi:hypothetical protein